MLVDYIIIKGGLKKMGQKLAEECRGCIINNLKKIEVNEDDILLIKADKNLSVEEIKRIKVHIEDYMEKNEKSILLAFSDGKTEFELVDTDINCREKVIEILEKNLKKLKTGMKREKKLK
mgnify:FL=1